MMSETRYNLLEAGVVLGIVLAACLAAPAVQLVAHPLLQAGIVVGFVAGAFLAVWAFGWATQ